MTRTEARKRTSRQLSYGYFQDRGAHAHAYCPECRAEVHADYLAWEKPVPALRTALISHLIEEH